MENKILKINNELYTSNINNVDLYYFLFIDMFVAALRWFGEDNNQQIKKPHTFAAPSRRSIS